MVTAGKGPGKGAFGQAGESRGLYSERLLIKRHYEALSTIARIYSHYKWMWGGIRVVGEINLKEQSTQDTGGKEKQTESGDKKGNWWKNEDNVVCWSEVLALTERKAAATKFAGNKFLRKEETNKLDPQKITAFLLLFFFLFDFM